LSKAHQALVAPPEVTVTLLLLLLLLCHCLTGACS
jgi:hypothetical protein